MATSSSLLANATLYLTDSPPETLWFGGTFDPPHHGHLIVARTAAEAIGAKRVILLPAAQSPHKQGVTSGTGGGTSPPEHRLAMCQAAVLRDPIFEVSDLELQRPAPSYTYDTARELFQQGLVKAGEKIRWLIGADQVKSLPRWHRAADLLQCVRFVIVARPGWDFAFAELPESFAQLEGEVVEAPLLEISATEIRKRVGEGKSIRYLVPEGVARYIESEGLYRNS